MSRREGCLEAGPLERDLLSTERPPALRLFTGRDRETRKHCGCDARPLGPGPALWGAPENAGALAAVLPWTHRVSKGLCPVPRPSLGGPQRTIIPWPVSSLNALYALPSGNFHPRPPWSIKAGPLPRRRCQRQPGILKSWPSFPRGLVLADTARPLLCCPHGRGSAPLVWADAARPILLTHEAEQMRGSAQNSNTHRDCPLWEGRGQPWDSGRARLSPDSGSLTAALATSLLHARGLAGACCMGCWGAFMRRFGPRA